MNLNIINNRIISISTTILMSLKKMDKEKVKMLFVFDDDKFISIVTIGDIQRAIINNISLDNSIESIINPNKKYCYEGDGKELIKSKMLALRAECMPILNSKGDLVNVIFWNDLFSNKKDHNETKIDIPVVIMAGGQGTRLKPLTNVIPKPLIPIGEKTILEEIMDRFENIGCKEFYISVNYKAEILEYYIQNCEHKYNFTVFKEDKPLGTIGSVSLLKDKIKTPFFVSNCDIIIDQDLRDVYEYHINNKNDITIISALKTYDIPYGVMETTADGLLSEIKEKPTLNYKINTGIYILQPELIFEIPEGEFYHITHLMEKVMQQGGRVGCFPISENSWTDIGEWNEYKKLINV